MVDISLPFTDLIRIGAKMLSHRIQQYHLTTNETVILPTKYGQVKGVRRKTIYDHQYYAFEGIPYAKPPVGELRFRAPQPPEPWTEIRNCMSPGNVPLQKHFVLGITHGSEDCLNLNVYTKELKTDKPLPVMVWIYGGAFQIGEASRDIYSPDYFMERNIVLVTINYRVGALGFLSLRDPDLQVPGNAGLKDQLLALHWIRENIVNFNGDPSNVTLFGGSAGAASSHLLMLTPKAKGLFHKAILQSGTALCSWAVTEPGEWAHRLAIKLGHKGGSSDKEIFFFLSQENGSKIVSAQNSLILPHEEKDRIIFSFVPVVEPYDSEECLLAKPYKDLLPLAWSNNIPLILGSNADEGLFFYAETIRKPFLVNELGDCVQVLPAAVKKTRGIQEHKELGLKLKKSHFGDKEPSERETLFQYLELVAYKNFWHDIHRTILARSAYAPTSPTYLYSFAFDSPYFNHYRIMACGKRIRGVCHGDDLSYIFHNVSGGKLPAESGEFKTIQRMIGMWTTFADTGDPNCEPIAPSVWLPVDRNDAKNARPKCLNISESIEFVTSTKEEKLKVWDSLYKSDNLY